MDSTIINAILTMDKDKFIELKRKIQLHVLNQKLQIKTQRFQLNGLTKNCKWKQ